MKIFLSNHFPLYIVLCDLRPAREGSLKPDRSARGIRIADSPLILIRGEDVGPISDQPVGLVPHQNNPGVEASVFLLELSDLEQPFYAKQHCGTALAIDCT